MTPQNFWIAILAAMAVTCLGLTAVALSSEYNDPHVDDDDYCWQYAAQQNGHFLVNYLVNEKVADLVCNCTTTYPNVALPNYQRVVSCERKAVEKWSGKN